VEVKEKAEKYPKNFSLIKMADKFRKQMEEGSSMSASILSTASNPRASVVTAQPAGAQDSQEELCPVHRRKIELICIDCKERICSNCALFGQHKPHDIRMEQDVLDEINTRTECLMEMYQIVEHTAAKKPDQQKVN
jgi:hypothetical protein